jgi:uncharacterized membrane protein YphA (DoxX/SURF4 family)
MKIVNSWYGHSLILNVSLVCANVIGLIFFFAAFSPLFEDYKIALFSVSVLLILASIIGIFIFKGKELFAYVSRVLVGSFFIFSGLIKANDPIGFSLKLKEYFEDGAIAYRIKTWFNSPSFSLEYLIDYSLLLGVLLCILEIVIGVFLVLGAKGRLTSWLLMFLLLFFTFLTWHTATCNEKSTFQDENMYLNNSLQGKSIMNQYLRESKNKVADKKIHSVQKSGNQLIVTEFKSPQCVQDCGCFGDALKGVFGRSLLPVESFWKDCILLYFSGWIFLCRRRIYPNSVSQNLTLSSISLALILVLCVIFNWYFPFLFCFSSLIASLWILKAGGKLLGNYGGSALIISVMSVIMVVYILTHEPMKDYSPYAVGNNLKFKMNDGVVGTYASMLTYKNKKTGELRVYNSISKSYKQSNIDSNPSWKFNRMITKTISPTKLPSITGQFDPVIKVKDLTKIDLRDPFLLKMKNQKIETEEITIRNHIVNSPSIYLIVSNDFDHADWSNIRALKDLKLNAGKKKTPMYLVSNSSYQKMEFWRKKYAVNIPLFTNDATELKVIGRSNVLVVILKKGKVLGKYPLDDLPKIEWLTKYILN